MTQLALNLVESRRLRDEGIEAVAASNASFVERVVEDVIRPLAESGKLFTADDVRSRAAELGLEPLHPNAWGAPMMTARRRGLIEATGVSVPSSRGVAHAHSNRAWRAARRPFRASWSMTPPADYGTHSGVRYVGD